MIEFFIDFCRSYAPTSPQNPSKSRFLFLPGSPLKVSWCLLVPRWVKMVPRPLPRLIFIVFQLNLMDFGPQLGGFWTSPWLFYGPTWKTLGPNLHDFATACVRQGAWRRRLLDRYKYIYIYTYMYTYKYIKSNIYTYIHTCIYVY